MRLSNNQFYYMKEKILAELVIDNAIKEFRKKLLNEQIDNALKIGDKENFLELTEKLKEGEVIVDY